MDLNQLLSSCATGDKVDIKLLTTMLFDEHDQKKIIEHIKATS